MSGTVLSLRFFVKLTLSGLYINSARNERISLPKLHPLCARLPHAVSQAITFRTDDLSCDFLKCRPLQACRQAAAR